MNNLILQLYINTYRKLLSSRLIPGEKVLDVGCGYGFLKEVCQALGCHYFGLDPRTEAIEYAKNKFGSDGFLVDNFSSFLTKKNNINYDVIICFTVIDSIREKKNFLMGMKSLLAENGTMFVSVRNGESIYKKITGNKLNDCSFQQYQDLFRSCELKIKNIESFPRPLVHEWSGNGVKQLLINCTNRFFPLQKKHMLLFTLHL